MLWKRKRKTGEKGLQQKVIRAKEVLDGGANRLMGEEEGGIRRRQEELRNVAKAVCQREDRLGRKDQREKK